MAKWQWMKTSMLAGVIAVAAGCAHTEYQAAYDCFDQNGLMVFGSTGSVDCIDRTEYALSKLGESDELAVTELPDPAALPE